MIQELFEKAKFGDRFVTRGGQEALFLRLTENSEWKFADFYVKDWGQIRVNRENGKCLNGPDIETDIVRAMPSLPSDIDVAANNYCVDVRLGYPRVMDETDRYIYNAFKEGAEWMAKQGQTEVDLKAVVRIDNIVMALFGEGYNDGYKTRPFYEEVLRRFNENKEK